MNSSTYTLQRKGYTRNPPFKVSHESPSRGGGHFRSNDCQSDRYAHSVKISYSTAQDKGLCLELVVAFGGFLQVTPSKERPQ